MILTDYTISSDDIKEFEQSTDIDTIKWLKFFKEFNPYDVSKEQSRLLANQVEEVKLLVPNSTINTTNFKEWKLSSLQYASLIDLGEVSTRKSLYSYKALIARMVLAYYLVQGKHTISNGQTIEQQVEALGL